MPKPMPNVEEIVHGVMVLNGYSGKQTWSLASLIRSEIAHESKRRWLEWAASFPCGWGCETNPLHDSDCPSCAARAELDRG